jgi:tetratricopeptide (TPR) repeat protein
MLIVAIARYNLGNTLSELGRFDEAAQKVESVAVYRSTVPGPHNETAWALTDLGSVEYQRRQYDEAERLHREAAAMFQKVDGDPTSVGKSWYGIGEVLYRRGQSADAEKYFRMNLELLKKHPDTPPAMVAWPETALGRLFIERGHPDEAEPLLQHAVASLRTDSAPQWRRAYADVLLGAYLTSRRRFEEAEPLLKVAAPSAHETAATDETRYAAAAPVALFGRGTNPQAPHGAPTLRTTATLIDRHRRHTALMAEGPEGSEKISLKGSRHPREPSV